MKCIICNTNMRFFFSKPFHAFNLSEVDYWQCPNCGFVISKTHADMTTDEWESLNYQYHTSYQGKEKNPDDSRWIERLEQQADLLSDAVRIGLLKSNHLWLDYACGDGKLSELLKKENLTLLKYDKYMPRRSDYLDESQLVQKKFDFVITTSVFEHFTLREQFDSIASLVTDSGVLGLHTMVCESIPCDSSWFYLVPVHCAFHTNKSMSLLFEQWGYAASVYNVDSRLWLWFKNAKDIEQIVCAANKRSQMPPYIFKNGFVDYWK